MSSRPNGSLYKQRVQIKIVVSVIPHGVSHVPGAMVTQDAVFAVM